MGHQDRQAWPRSARCTLCQRSQARGPPGGVRSARDLLAGSVRPLHDRDPNGLAAYVTSRAHGLATACSPGKAVAKAAQEHQPAQLARELQARSRPCASSGQSSLQATADWRLCSH